MSIKRSAGKGDSPKPYNIERYLANFEKIHWGNKNKQRRKYL